MFEINVSGTYYEMGQIIGEILKQVGFVPEQITEASIKRINFAEKCENVVKEYMPDMIDYLKGIADGGNFEYNRIKILPLVLGYSMPQPPSCSICYVSSEFSETSQPFLFRNYDFNWFLENLTNQWHSTPENGIESYSFCDLWAGAHCGLNAKGLLVAISSAPAYTGEWQPGLSMNLLTQWMLNNYTTVSEAVQFLQTVPHMASFNFIIVDNDKNVARVIGTPQKVSVEIIQDKNIIQTNHMLIDDMKSLENPRNIARSSIPRYKNLQEWLNQQKGKVNAKEIEDICRKSIAEGGIFEDDEFNGVKFGTLWSWYYDFQTQKLHIAPGNPQNHEYKMISFD